MSEREPGKPIPGSDPVAVELRLAVHAGDVGSIQRLLQNDRVLATARLGGGGGGTATPLHCAASSDDVDVAEALIEGGADIEVPHGSIGAPL